MEDSIVLCDRYLCDGVLATLAQVYLPLIVAKRLPCSDSEDYNEQEVLRTIVRIEHVSKDIHWDDVLVDLIATNMTLDSEILLSLSPHTLARVLTRKHNELKQALESGYVSRMTHEVHGYRWEGIGKYNDYSQAEMQINHDEGAKYL